MRLHFHEGQWTAWNATERFVLALGGKQGGKTSFGPLWALRETARCGQGDGLIVAPTFSLLDLKALPSFIWLFETMLHLGHYVSSPSRKFIFSEEGERRLFGERYDPYKSTRVLFGYATEPESLESATANWAWLDEGGQRRFKLGSFEAVRGRLTLAVKRGFGRALVTTSLYCDNWVKTLYDRWLAGDKSICVSQFDSTLNPQFSPVEFENLRATMPRWKFRMQYEAKFDRPPGLIYDCIQPSVHYVPRFEIPKTWRRLTGHDFGSANMAAVFVAEEPETKRHFVYRTYHQGGMSVPGHVRQLKHGESAGAGEAHPMPLAVGGASSEDDWRDQFRKAGWGIRRPKISSVEVGVDAVYGAFQTNELFIFDDLAELKEEVNTYSRVLDEHGNATEAIEDKEDYHLLDSLRYVESETRGGARKARSGKVALRARRNAAQSPVASVTARTDAEVERLLDG